MEHSISKNLNQLTISVKLQNKRGAMHGFSIMTY